MYCCKVPNKREFDIFFENVINLQDAYVASQNILFLFSRILRNGIKVDSSYTTSGRDSSNTYSFLAATEDNNAKFRCESKNELSTEPLTAEIVLSVQCK